MSRLRQNSTTIVLAGWYQTVCAMLDASEVPITDPNIERICNEMSASIHESVAALAAVRDWPDSRLPITEIAGN
jgi:hypothetical protein